MNKRSWKRLSILVALTCVVAGSGRAADDGRASASQEFEFALGRPIPLDLDVGDIRLATVTMESQPRENAYLLSIEIAASNRYSREKVIRTSLDLLDADGGLVARCEKERGIGERAENRTIRMKTELPEEPSSAIATVRLMVENWDKNERNTFSERYPFELDRPILIGEPVGRVQFESLLIERKGGGGLQARVFGRNDGGHDQMVVAMLRFVDAEGETVFWAQDQKMIEEEGKRNAVKLKVEPPPGALDRVAGIVLELTTWDK